MSNDVVRVYCMLFSGVVYIYRKARTLDNDLHFISNSLKSIEISEHTVRIDSRMFIIHLLLHLSRFSCIIYFRNKNMLFESF